LQSADAAVEKGVNPVRTAAEAAARILRLTS